MTSDEETIARTILRDHDEGRRFVSFAGDYGIADLDAAYAVQDAYVTLLSKRHGPVVGYKIGATSIRIQQMVGLDAPIGGYILRDRLHDSGVTMSLAGFGRAGIEFELAVKLGRSIDAATYPETLDELARAVAAVAPAFAIIDDRDAEYGKVDFPSIVADNSWNGGAVVGPWSQDWPDLAAIEGVVERDGEEIDRGHGREVLGHPLEPLLWLARHVTARGRVLEEGAVVLTGSMVETRFAKAGEHYRFTLEGLGSVELALDA